MNFSADCLPFAQPGRFYRGNLHGHSTNSDGDWSPAEVIRQYRQNGYDFVAITDHFLDQYDYPITDTRGDRTDDFTTLIGAELHHGALESGYLWHLLALGLPLDFAPYRVEESTADVVARAREAGAFLAAAHPNWYTLTLADFETLGPMHAVECFNGNADRYNDRADSWHFIDMLLAREHRIGAIAVDDSHMRPGRDDFLRGWVHLKAASLSPDALIHALKAGHYYSSTGPALHHVELTGRDILVIECSPAVQILVSGAGPIALQGSGSGLTGADFDISEFESTWLRVTVRDEYSRRAWTNPVWLC